jgi:hypothetical protein
MSKRTAPTFASIDPSQLSSASGGRRAAGSLSRSSGASDDRILDALRDLRSELASLGKNNNNDNSALMTTLLTTMFSNQQQAAPAPAPVFCGRGRNR